MKQIPRGRVEKFQMRKEMTCVRTLFEWNQNLQGADKTMVLKITLKRQQQGHFCNEVQNAKRQQDDVKSEIKTKSSTTD